MTREEEREMKRLRRKLENARGTLRVILTWSVFESPERGLPRGHALVPEHVEDLCRKTLEETK